MLNANNLFISITTVLSPVVTLVKAPQSVRTGGPDTKKIPVTVLATASIP